MTKMERFFVVGIFAKISKAVMKVFYLVSLTLPLSNLSPPPLAPPPLALLPP